MGALFARVAGLTNPSTGMPNNALITARVFGEKYKHLYENVDRVSQNGSLPAAYRPLALRVGSMRLTSGGQSISGAGLRCPPAGSRRRI